MGSERVVQRGLALTERIGGPGVIMLLLWPWMLLLVNPNWIYLNVTGHVDAWIYLGHFLNLRTYVALYPYPDFYYSTRLSWVLPGFAAYHTLPPLAANLVLRLGVFYLTTLSVYGTLAMTVGRRAGLLAVLLLGGYSYFVLAAGWDYVDGAGIAYLALTLFLLTRAARHPRPHRTLALAGGAAAAMIAANIATATLVPYAATLYLLLLPRRSTQRLIYDTLAAISGAVVLLTLIGLVNIALGGEFLFLRRSLQFAQTTANLPANPWNPSEANWAVRYGHVVWPQIVTGAVLLHFGVPPLRARLRTVPHASAFFSAYLVVVTLMLAWQLRAATPLLQVPYYASYLIVPLFLALGALIARSLMAIGTRQYTYLLVVAGVVSLFGPLARACEQVTTVHVALALALGGVAVAALAARPANMWPMAALVAALGLGTPSAFSDSGALSTCRAIRTSERRPVDEYQAAVAANTVLNEIAPGRRLYFWYNQREDSLFRGIASMRLYAWNLVGETFPVAQRLPSDATVVLVTRQRNALAEAEKTLAANGHSMKPIGQQTVTSGAVAFDLYVFEVRPIPPKLISGQALDLSASNADAGRALVRGWSAPETFGSWTNGRVAEMAFVVDDALKDDLVLTLEIVETIRAFSTDRSPLGVEVQVNGTALERWVFDESQPAGVRQVRIPALLQTPDHTLRVVLLVDSPRRADGAGSNDQRLLGVAVRSARVDQP